MRTRIIYVLAVLVLLLLVGGGFINVYLKTLAPKLKQRVISALQDRFNADVQLADLQFSVFPSPSVDGEGLVINHKEWASDQHPLIRIRHFHAATDYTTLLDWRNRVDKVVLEGLEIHVPPRGRSSLKSAKLGKQEMASDEPGHDAAQFKFLINTISADDALVEIEPKKQGKDPLRFPIDKLIMHSVGPGKAMLFTARLNNAKPPGVIDTSGHFGPWQRDDPRSTPLDGNYTFENADLSVFKGISGTLASKGSYGGILQNIKVDGVTDVPQFALKKGGSSVHLTTRFHAVVDGTNGDTLLEPVDAKFGNSEFLCSGGIVQLDGQKGKTVQLDARTKQGRMEDILTLLADGKPMLKGEMQFQSKIVIPPGQQRVADKLRLDGDFHLSSATFTSEKAEERLRLLSNRASGINKAEESRGEGERGNVASEMQGKFKLDDGALSLASLAFEVPGAHIQIAGTYNLNSSQIDMKGKFQMRSTLSQTQSGIKAVLLKPVDPLFKKDGAGFEVPISIAGTRDRPVIGASAFHKTFTIH